ncbi:MAG: type II toxin-antitoxin system RelE/ParE family toxin [Lachnospiraceae bacterium]|nr:type II toxin-antitoxin system RelE/ParE family toxin [Lachnospiraceae bacterium]
MEIEYSKQAAKFISSQDRNTKQRIKKGIERLTEIPPKGDIKPLQGYTNGTNRLRIGKYRIVYRYYLNADLERILFISDIDSRGDIYK